MQVRNVHRAAITGWLATYYDEQGIAPPSAVRTKISELK
jgi:hypothetical protein